MHGITFSTDDKPKLLSQLTALLAEVGLNIQEAHAFSTTDGYSLDVFVVDGWPYEAQYHDWIRLLEDISRYKAYVEISHLRLAVSVSEAKDLWWRYAIQTTLQLKKVCYRFSWDQIQHLCQLRRYYIQLYAGSLQQLSCVNNSEIRDIGKDLNPKAIPLWRFLSHAKVESVKSKEEAEQRMLRKFSLIGHSPDDASICFRGTRVCARKIHQRRMAGNR